MTLLGIDGGGTKTVCLLIDEAGQVLGRGEAGPSNYQTVGIEVAQHSIKLAMTQAILNSSLDKHSPIVIEGLGMGLAGVGRPEDVQVIQNLVQQLHNNTQLPVNWQLQPENIVITGDSLIALVGGLGHSVGIVVIAGTGSHIFGQNQHGMTKRVGGWGYILGDEGSGYHIAVRGLQAALRSYDGRLPSTNLVEQFKTHLGLNSIEGLIEVIYRRGWSVNEIAALAPIVDQVAATGDEIAQQIIKDAVEELVLGAKVAILALFNPLDTFEIVTMGGIFQGMTSLRHQFETAIAQIAPAALVIQPRHEPAFGAALLARKNRAEGRGLQGRGQRAEGRG